VKTDSWPDFFQVALKVVSATPCPSPIKRSHPSDGRQGNLTAHDEQFVLVGVRGSSVRAWVTRRIFLISR
jgi:hypothetical protein